MRPNKEESKGRTKNGSKAQEDKERKKGINRKKSNNII